VSEAPVWFSAVPTSNRQAENPLVFHLAAHFFCLQARQLPYGAPTRESL